MTHKEKTAVFKINDYTKYNIALSLMSKKPKRNNKMGLNARKAHKAQRDIKEKVIIPKLEAINFDRYPAIYQLNVINDIYNLERRVQKYQEEFAKYEIVYNDIPDIKWKTPLEKPSCVQNYLKIAQKSNFDMEIPNDKSHIKTVGNPDEEIGSKYHPALIFKTPDASDAHQNTLSVAKDMLFSSAIKLEPINENIANEEDKANGSSILEDGEIEGHNIESNLFLNEIDRLINLKEFYGEKLLKGFDIYYHIKQSSEKVLVTLIESIPEFLQYHFKDSAFKLYTSLFIETMFATINQELTEALYLCVQKDKVDKVKEEVFSQIKGNAEEFDNKFYYVFNKKILKEKDMHFEKFQKRVYTDFNLCLIKESQSILAYNAAEEGASLQEHYLNLFHLLHLLKYCTILRPLNKIIELTVSYDCEILIASVTSLNSLIRSSIFERIKAKQKSLLDMANSFEVKTKCKIFAQARELRDPKQKLILLESNAKDEISILKEIKDAKDAMKSVSDFSFEKDKKMMIAEIELYTNELKFQIANAKQDVIDKFNDLHKAISASVMCFHLKKKMMIVMQNILSHFKKDFSKYLWEQIEELNENVLKSYQIIQVSSLDGGATISMEQLFKLESDTTSVCKQDTFYRDFYKSLKEKEKLIYQHEEIDERNEILLSQIHSASQSLFSIRMRVGKNDSDAMGAADPNGTIIVKAEDYEANRDIFIQHFENKFKNLPNEFKKAVQNYNVFASFKLYGGQAKRNSNEYFMKNIAQEFEYMLKHEDSMHFVPEKSYYHYVQIQLNNSEENTYIIKPNSTDIKYNEFKIIPSMEKILLDSFSLRNEDVKENDANDSKGNSLSLINKFYLNKLYCHWRKLTLKHRDDLENQEKEKELDDTPIANKEAARDQRETAIKAVEKDERNEKPAESKYTRAKNLRDMMPFLHDIYNPKKNN